MLAFCCYLLFSLADALTLYGTLDVPLGERLFRGG